MEYGARYGARVPLEATYSARIGKYLDADAARLRRPLRRLVARPPGA